MRLLSLCWAAATLLSLAVLAVLDPAPEAWAIALVALLALSALAVLALPLVEPGLDPLPWRLLGAGLLAFVAAGALDVRAVLDGTPATYPGAADLLRIGGAVLAACALGVIVRRRTPGRDWDAMLDASVVALGVAAVVWTLVDGLLGPDASLPASARLVGIASLLAGLAVVVLSVRLVASVGPRDPLAATLLAGSLVLLTGVVLLVSDRLDGVVAGHLAAGLVVAGVALIAAAALDPTLAGASDRSADPGDVSHADRVVLVGGGALAIAGCVAWGLLHGGVSGPAAVAVVVALGLVGARVAVGLQRFQEALERENVLQAGSAALVAARSQDEVRAAATATALELAGGHLAAYAALELDRQPDLAIEDAVVVGSDDAHTRALRGSIRRGGSLGRLGTARTFVVPIVVGDRPRGILRVTGRRPLPRELYRAAATLGEQISLALESIERGEAAFELRSEARFRALVQSSRDLITVLEPDLRIRYVTPSVQEMLGLAPTELVGTPFTALLDPDEADEVVELLRRQATGATPLGRVFRLRCGDGRWRVAEAVVNDLCADPDVSGLVVTAHDVTERRQLEVQLTHQAFHDALTDLPNRALLADRVEHALARARRTGSEVALLFLDVDDFKTVNDSLGHSAGDEMLVQVASRLRGCLREADTAARLGGDEFAILLEGQLGTAGAIAAAQRILEEVARPVTIATTEVDVRASIGIVVSPPDRTVGELLRSADVAMYEAKREGGSRFALFEPHMHEQARNRLELKADLEKAFRDDRLDVHYQPLIDLGTGRPTGFEALLRWTHPVRGPVGPAEFVPLAEETGLINEIGEWVLRRACLQTRAWQSSVPGYGRLSVNVNLAARQILQPGFVAMVDGVLVESGLPAEDLVLEITEGTMLVDVEGVAARLAELRAHGVRIAIDDFGTGFSSLAYLQRFPLDELKIAREFVDEVVIDERRGRLVEAIVTLARSLDLETIAEGIEEPAQLARLKALGCTVGQGYLFSKPLPAADVPPLLVQALAA